MALIKSRSPVPLWYKVGGWEARDLVSCYYFDKDNNKSSVIKCSLIETVLWFVEVELSPGIYLFVFMENGVRTTIQRVVVTKIDVDKKIRSLSNRVQNVMMRQPGPISGNY